MTDATSPTPAPPEARFLDYARTGNTSLLHALIEEFSDCSFNQARRIIGSDDGAEDAVQEAYLRLVRTAKRYDGSVLFAAWLGRLVHAAAVDHRRWMQRQRRFNQPVNQGAAIMHQTAASNDATAIDALRTMLETLPERYRNPLMLHYFCGLSRIEAAQALEVPAWTLETRLARGLERLRKKYARAGFAMTTAGLLAAFASVPTYGASPALKTGLLHVASQPLAGAAAPTSQAAGVIRFAVAGAALAAAIAISLHTGILSGRSHEMMTVAAPRPDQGLVAHWSFDEGRGAIAFDASGNGNTAHLINGPSWTKGRIGGALSFDGIDDHAIAPSSPSLNSIKGQMTVAAWVYLRGKHETDAIVQRRLGSGHGDLWNLYRETASCGFSVAFEDDSGAMAALPNIDIGLGRWTHLAGVYDGTHALYYQDGSLRVSVPFTEAIPDETSPVVIGAGDNGDYSGISDFCDAIIDDVRVYDRALSSEEIQTMSHSGSIP